MLVRLMYASRAASPMDQEELLAILRQSQAHNPARGITGVLCFSGGLFIQVLEGGRASVNQLYQHISRDARHTELLLLTYEEISERRFANWAMGLVHLGRLNPAVLLKYSETATLDPYATPGQATAQLFDELLATAAIMGQC
jgi:hypothetical protein